MGIIARKRSFRALVVTHFLTIINDNLYKFLLVFSLLEGKTLEENAKILSLVSFFFALPYILLAPFSGSLADRFQKRNIILFTRVIEIFCAILGVYFFHIHSVVGGYFVLVSMACHSAIFGPAKMGILPEMLPIEELSKANGAMTAATYSSSILGSCLAPLMVDLTKDFVTNSYELSACFCVVSSVLSLFIALGIRASNVKNKGQKIAYVSFRNLWKVFQEARNIAYLMISVFLVAFFLFVGAYVQLQIIPFVEFTLGYSKHYGAYLFPIVAVGMGVGSYMAGWISGKDIKLGFSPLAAIGVGLSMMVLCLLSFSITAVLILLFCLGLFGGIYQVPLHAYIQFVSPEHKRGQVLALNNFLDFSGVLLAAGFVRLLGSGLRLTPDQSFLYMGSLVVCFAILSLWMLKEHVYRLLLTRVLKRQLGTSFSSPKAEEVRCFFVPTTSYKETRRILALFPKTVRSCVFILDKALQPGWTSYLIPHCVPTIFSYGVEGQAFAQWIDRQVVEVKALLKRQPSLGVVCLGNQAQSQFFFSQLQASGLAVQSGTLVQDSELKYSLHLAN